MNPAIPATRLVTPVELREKGKGVGVYADAPIPEGDVLFRLTGPASPEPRRHTIQVDADVHLDEAGFLEGYLNHSCSPNAFVDFSDTKGVYIRALDDIGVGDEIRINYCATEEDMAEVFHCDCGSEECYGDVSGFNHLSMDQKKGLVAILSPYLRKKHGFLSPES